MFGEIIKGCFQVGSLSCIFLIGYESGSGNSEPVSATPLAATALNNVAMRYQNIANQGCGSGWSLSGSDSRGKIGSQTDLQEELDPDPTLE